MSFVKIGGKLFASTLSTLGRSSYTEVVTKVVRVKDTRKVKYAPEGRSMDIDVQVVMGPKSQQTLRGIIELAQYVPDDTMAT